MRALKLVNGIPRMTNMSAANNYYDASLTLGSLPANSILTLPNSEGYYGSELRVYKAGQFLEMGIDYEIVGSVQPYTQIKIYEATISGETIRFRRNREADLGAIYDATYVPSGTLNAGTIIQLPNSGYYEGADLEVYINGEFIEPLVDYNYVGLTATKTEISLTFDAYPTDRIRFRRGD